MRERLDAFAAGIGDLAEGLRSEEQEKMSLPPLAEESFSLAIASLEAARHHMQMAAYLFSRGD